MTAATVDIAQMEALARALTPDELDALQRRFPKLTTVDALAVVTQRPDATDVRPYVAWLRHGRRVRHGEHGIILPPIADGRPRARVFDIDQTDTDDEAPKTLTRASRPKPAGPPDPALLAWAEATIAGGTREQPMKLATSRYQAWQPVWSEWAVPIRITVGHPRFVRYPLERALALAPWELFSRGGRYEPRPEDVELLLYNRRMEQHAAEILQELAAVAAKHPGKVGVLMCYEDVYKGEVCHRRWAADWFAARYGWNIPELGGEMPVKPRSLDVPNPTLF